MEAQMAAKIAQGYSKLSPVSCYYCGNRAGDKCGLGGFPVRLAAACRQWSRENSVLVKTEKGDKVFPKRGEF